MAMRRSASEPNLAHRDSPECPAANATRLGVEVAAGQHLAAVREDRGLSETPFASVANMAAACRSKSKHGTHHLRLTAQGNTVLNASIGLAR